MMMSRALLIPQNTQKFIDDLKIGLDQTTSNAVDFYYNGIGNSNSRFAVWTKVKDGNKSLLENYRTSAGITYTEYTPSFTPNQTREVLFSTDLTATPQVKTTLQNIYSGRNNNTQTNPYNFKRKFN